MTTDSNSNSAIPKITRDDEEAGSGDLARENVERLKALFPQIVADGKVDFDVLRQLLGDEVEDGEERYGLNWRGKRRARAFAMTPSLGTLRPAPEDSVDWDTTQNIMIEGDNLEVLKLLRRSYAGKVKLIYIDPPYNTGNDFVYNDDYRNPIRAYLSNTGQIEEGASRTSRNEKEGRIHTDWLTMIMPRLFLAKEMLAEGGVIAISLDENETFNLLSICDEIFGPENKIGSIAAEMNPKGRQLDAFFATSHEYIHFYGRSAMDAEFEPASSEAVNPKDFPLEDENGNYRLLPLRNTNKKFNPTTRPNLAYKLYGDPKSGRVSATTFSGAVAVDPVFGDGSLAVWRWSKPKVEKQFDELFCREVAGRDGDRVDIFQKDYNNEGRKKKLKTVWNAKEVGSSDSAIAENKALGLDVFSNPKPVSLLRRIIEMAASDAVVLDFFAGSGSTGHAVMQQNALDGGDRRFILVQLPESLDQADTSQAKAAEFCERLRKPLNIAELTKERLRRAGEKVREENPDSEVDSGFRVYKLTTSNLKPWQPDPDNLEASILDAVDNVLPDRSEDDLLVELLLKTGIDLTMPEEKREIAGEAVHALGGGALMVCLGNIADEQAEELGQGMADWVDELDPAQTTVYFKDSGIGSDGNRAATKANLAAILRQRLGDRVAKIASI